MRTPTYLLVFALFFSLAACDTNPGLTDAASAPETASDDWFSPENLALLEAEAQWEDEQEMAALGYTAKGGMPWGLLRGMWNQFGKDRGNTNRTRQIGPFGGISSATTLTPSLGGTIGSEVGVITDDDDDYVVTSYDPYLHIFDNAGSHVGLYSFPVSYGPRAVPHYDARNDFIYTGAEGGGFYEIHVDKTTSPYTLTLNSSDATVGTIESSPVMARDGTVYVVTQWGDVKRYATNPLTLLATYSTGDVVTGAPALYNSDPTSPGDELIVATNGGYLYVLSHDLSTVLGSNSDGATGGDLYYAGVTVARRAGSGLGPVALLGVTSQVGGPYSTATGNLRAINLWTLSTEWETTPSNTTTGGTDQIEGSIAVQHVRFGRHLGVASSTDGYLYAFDLTTGTEQWSYNMGCDGKAAPAIGRYNGVYALDGCGYLHVLGGGGSHQYTDGTLYIGSTTDIGKIALTAGSKIGVGSGSTAYILQ